MQNQCSIRQMAEFLHMPKSTVHNILSGQQLSLKQSRKIAKALQVSHTRLLDCPPEKIAQAIAWRMQNTDWFDELCGESSTPN